MGMCCLWFCSCVEGPAYYESSYSGIELDLGSMTLFGYQGIVFKVRGNGAAYRVKLTMQLQLA